MTSAFTYKDEVERIEFEDGEWVDIKRELSAGDEEAISNEILRIRLKPQAFGKGGPAKKEDIEEVSLKVGSIITVYRAIVAWSFKDRDGKDAPVTMTNVASLKRPIFNRLLEEVGRRNPL